MNQSLGLHQKMVQTLSITPQMIQTLKILQYSTTELLDHIQHELAENPFLVEEIKNAHRDFEDSAHAHMVDEKQHYLEYVDYTYKEGGFIKGSQPASTHDKSLIIEQTAHVDEKLSDVLLEQLNYHYPLDSTEHEIGEHIIGSLDKDGYLSKASRSEIIAQLRLPERYFDDVHAQIKNFEPSGIGSSNLQECLLKQAETLTEGKDSIEYLILKYCFPLLEKKKYKEISKTLEVDQEEIDFAVHNISLLEPRPGRRYQSLDPTLVIPDVSVLRENGELRLYINDEYIPKVHFNKEYKTLLKIKDNPQLSKYIHEKEDKARTLLSSLKYRVSNLQKVMQRLMVVQAEFFEKGHKALKPYTLLKLSEEIHINQGTLSRIINSKYIQTEWGTFSLKIFFSSALPSVKGDVSSNKIKSLIKEIIHAYEGTKKLSDQKITEALAKKGFNVARRTVSKYRKELSILSSFHR